MNRSAKKAGINMQQTDHYLVGVIDPITKSIRSTRRFYASSENLFYIRNRGLCQ
jgi:hypothetical protein